MQEESIDDIAEILDEKRELFDNNPKEFDRKLEKYRDGIRDYGPILTKETTIVSDRDESERREVIDMKVKYLVMEAVNRGRDNREYDPTLVSIARTISSMNPYKDSSL